MNGPIARGTIRTTFVLGLRLVVQAGTLLFVARMLGPSQFGAFAGMAALAVMLGTLSSFGTQLVLLGEVSKKSTRRYEVLRYAIPTTLLCGGILFAGYVSIYTLTLSKSGVALSVLLTIGITEMWLQPLFVLPTVELLARGHVARSQLLQALPLVLRLLTAASVWLLHLASPLIAYGYGYLAASLLSLGYALHTMPSPWPTPSHWRIPKHTELREAMGYAALSITATGPAELDKTLATKLLSPTASGLYASSARVVGAVILPITAMMLSALPRLFREGQSQPHRTARLLRWIFAATLGYSTVLAGALWFAAPIFVWLFGTKYNGIQHVVHWLVLAVPGMALRTSAGSVLMAMGKPWMRAGLEASGLAVLVTTATILAPKLGAAGMSLALTCSEWAMAGAGILFASHMLAESRACKAASPHGIPPAH